MRSLRHMAAALVLALPMPGLALDLPAGARPLAERISPFARYELPLNRVQDDLVPSQTYEGRISRRTWRLLSGATSLQVLAPLRDQLLAEGFTPVFECQSDSCGGFDFRFGIEVVPAPDMAVDIGDFLFLSATKGTDQAVSLLVSRSSGALYIQLIEVLPTDTAALTVSRAAPPPQPDPQSPPQPAANRDVATTLDQDGHMVLSDLVFETGSTALGAGPFASLVTLADYLAATPTARIALVGHTDSVGGLAQNTDLSLHRAQSVRDRLVSAHGADAAQIEVAGVGYLAPIASNQIEAGREANRRVEVVLTSSN